MGRCLSKKLWALLWFAYNRRDCAQSNPKDHSVKKVGLISPLFISLNTCSLFSSLSLLFVIILFYFLLSFFFFWTRTWTKIRIPESGEARERLMAFIQAQVAERKNDIRTGKFETQTRSGGIGKVPQRSWDAFSILVQANEDEEGGKFKLSDEELICVILLSFNNFIRAHVRHDETTDWKRLYHAFRWARDDSA